MCHLQRLRAEGSRERPDHAVAAVAQRLDLAAVKRKQALAVGVPGAVLVASIASLTRTRSRSGPNARPDSQSLKLPLQHEVVAGDVQVDAAPRARGRDDGFAVCRCFHGGASYAPGRGRLGTGFSPGARRDLRPFGTRLLGRSPPGGSSRPRDGLGSVRFPMAQLGGSLAGNDSSDDSSTTSSGVVGFESGMSHPLELSWRELASKES